MTVSICQMAESDITQMLQQHVLRYRKPISEIGVLAFAQINGDHDGLKAVSFSAGDKLSGDVAFPRDVDLKPLGSGGRPANLFHTVQRA